MNWRDPPVSWAQDQPVEPILAVQLKKTSMLRHGNGPHSSRAAWAGACLTGNTSPSRAITFGAGQPAAVALGGAGLQRGWARAWRQPEAGHHAQQAADGDAQRHAAHLGHCAVARAMSCADKTHAALWHAPLYTTCRGKACGRQGHRSQAQAGLLDADGRISNQHMPCC